MDERSLRSLRAPFQEGILVHAKKHLLKRSSEDVMKPRMAEGYGSMPGSPS